MRVVIELKRDAYSQVVLNNLYKQTPLQANFGVNMLAIVNGEPRTLTLRDSLQTFLDFREEVIERRTRYQLNKAEERDHILQGLLRALSNLDRIIALIRGAADAPTAKAGLEEEFGLSDAQADAILQMQLRRLTALEAEKIQAEHEDLVLKIADLRDILSRRERVLDIIKEELTVIQERFNSKRATQICLDDGDIDDADLIENREIVVFLTEQGYIKRLDIEEFEVQGRATRGKAGTRMKEDDAVQHFFVCRSHDTVLFFSNRGIVFTLRGYQLPRGSRTSRGTPLLQMLSISKDERITSVIPVAEFTDDEYLIMLTQGGFVKKTALSAFANVRSNGLIAISLEEGDQLRWVRRARSTDNAIVATKQGMAIRFQADGEQLRPLGRATRGVRAMSLNAGDTLVSLDIISAETSAAVESGGEIPTGPWVLAVTSGGYGKRTAISEFRIQNRGGKGLTATKFRKPGQELASLQIVNADDEVMIVTARGIVIRQRAAAIPTQSRMATGVRVQRLDDEDAICAVTIVPAAMAETEAEVEEIASLETALDTDTSDTDDASDTDTGEADTGEADNA
jgi:DNA gyrase subunit A